MLNTTADAEQPNRIRRQVIWATLITATLGLVMFLIMAWLQIEAPLRSMWFSKPDGNQWFDAARTTVTIMGIIGIGGAAYLTYRRQHTTEMTHGHEIKTYRIDRRDATERDLRSRYTASVSQLGSESPAIRLAGVYALASLADDWHAAGDDDERQVCIDVLRAYLRMDLEN
ncbi:hypothetical protein FEZ60_04800 [Rhodococcus sp. MS16]|uniref:hypothetical protein n=1 Tax=Rhodococcus sp. MS16 TaxID=2579941 RepID=UPI0015627001|nr:hypothetical protein [Rhodococcus sp. MS16]NRI64859.1 hypothetical protein [Rhodococcus sp. MS16]